MAWALNFFREKVNILKYVLELNTVSLNFHIDYFKFHIDYRYFHWWNRSKSWVMQYRDFPKKGYAKLRKYCCMHCIVAHASPWKAKVYNEVWNVYSFFLDGVKLFGLDTISNESIYFSNLIIHIIPLSNRMMAHALLTYWPNVWAFGPSVNLA